jgi:hypothetical protein
MQTGLAGEPLLPILCKDARGTAKIDYTDPEGPWNAYAAPAPLCWYKVAALRRLFPEYKDMAEANLSNLLYERAGITLTPARPWEIVGIATSLAFGVPILVLLMGWAVGWAASGFSTPRAPGT